jgi:hypothetical protein
MVSVNTKQSNVDAAIAKLVSLHDGDIGVVETIDCGNAAIPKLRAILFSREPSGLYETRRRAVEALQGLRAFDVLRAYLNEPREITDPIERTGEDAVINAAARALGRFVDTRDLPLLFSLIRQRPLAGVIETLGNFRQTGALPYFIKALGDDFTRPSAENAIRRFGNGARNALLAAALDRVAGHEHSSSISRRRSALKLLESVSLPRDTMPTEFRTLIKDDDPWIALRASRLCLSHLAEPEAKATLARLAKLLQSADGLLARDIEDVLVEYYQLVQSLIEVLEQQMPAVPAIPIWRSNDHTRQVFANVKKRVSSGTMTSGCRHE